MMDFYRYQETPVYTGSEIITQYRLDLHEFEGIKETPRGWWIRKTYGVGGIHGPKRWVSKTSKKRYAYPTKSEALKSYKSRKQRQIDILEHQIKQAKEGLRLAEVSK